MKIGVDLDGVIIDNYPYWREYFVENEVAHNHSLRDKDMAVWASPSWDYLQNICRKCWDKCLHDPRFILGYKPRYEAILTLQWFNFLGMELHLITNRPKDVTDMTMQWLDKHCPVAFKTKNVVTDKTYLAKELGLHYMVDDAPHNIIAFSHSPTECLIWDMPYNSHLKGNRVNTWYQVANIFVAAHQKEIHAISNT